MITNTGKTIIGKYLLGQAPAFASYIAVGCGPKPRPNINSLTNCSTVSLGTTVTTTSTEGLWIGAFVHNITAGAGSIPNTAVVASIINSTQFTLSVAPTVALSGATISIEIDKEKESLDFEMFRVPISSRGYVQENGMNKIVLTAELPTEERYEITEVGLYSAGANPSAGSYDSKTVFAFTDAESWQHHKETVTLPIPTITEQLDTENDNIITGSYLINSLNKEYDIVNGVLTATPVFQANSDNSIFYKEGRTDEYERCRFLNNTILMQGDTSTLTVANNHLNIVSGSHIHVTGVDIDFDNNSVKDELRLAFSLVRKNGGSNSVPDTVRILVDFSSNDEENSPQFARFEVDLDNGTDPGEYNFAANRYFVISKPIQDLYTSPSFSWNAVNVVKIYASVLSERSIDQKSLTSNVATIRTTSDHGFSIGDVVSIDDVDPTFNGQYTITAVPTTTSFRYSKTYSGTIATADVIPSGTVSKASSDYYVALDALRLENVATKNPLYGLTGYTIVQNTDAESVIKSPNTNNYIEFRFSIGVS
jgi:hypothetical protein